MAFHIAGAERYGSIARWKASKMFNFLIYFSGTEKVQRPKKCHPLNFSG